MRREGRDLVGMSEAVLRWCCRESALGLGFVGADLRIGHDETVTKMSEEGVKKGWRDGFD